MRKQERERALKITSSGMRAKNLLIRLLTDVRISEELQNEYWERYNEYVLKGIKEKENNIYINNPTKGLK